MSGITTATAIAGLSAAAGIVGAVVQHSQAASAAKREEQANAQNQSNSKATLQASEEATNRANARAPNTAAIDQTNGGSGGGPGATTLTGPTGIDPNSLTLGKNTLLGE